MKGDGEWGAGLGFGGDEGDAGEAEGDAEDLAPADVLAEEERADREQRDGEAFCKLAKILYQKGANNDIESRQK